MGAGKTFLTKHAGNLLIGTTDGEQYARGPFSVPDYKAILSELASFGIAGRGTWGLREVLLYSQLTLQTQADRRRYDIYLCHTFTNILLLNGGQVPRFVARMISPLDVHLERIRARQSTDEPESVEASLKLARDNHETVRSMIFPFCLDVLADDEGKESLIVFARKRAKLPLSTLPPDVIWSFAKGYIDDQHDREQQRADRDNNAAPGPSSAGEGQEDQNQEERTAESET